MRDARRRRTQSPIGSDESAGCTGVPVYEILPESDVQKILDATFALMREIGVAFDPDPKVLDLFSDAGCEITSDNAVRFDRELVEQSLDSVSKSAKVWNRDASHYLEIKEGVTSFFPGMTCIKVLDLETGKPRVEAGDGSIRVTVFEPIVGRELEIGADLVVLATGVVPNLPGELAAAFGAAVDPDGFFQEAESKWRPVDSVKEGVFACGLALCPHSVTESIATAEAAAQRALRILWRDRLPAPRTIATVRSSLCSLCERCIDACPYAARTLDPDRQQVLVNTAMCQGCGECATVCPNNASVVDGFRQQQMMEIIDAALN